jgi:hypothetical protein
MYHGLSFVVSTNSGRWYNRVIGCIIRLAILAAIEWVWIKFPATPVSSATLTLMHIIIFISHALPSPGPAAVSSHEHQS